VRFSELCLKNLNQLASIGLVDMDEDCFLLRPTGLWRYFIIERCDEICVMWEFEACSKDDRSQFSLTHDIRAKSCKIKN